MFKKFFCFLVVFFGSFILFNNQAFAQKAQQAVIVNPIRGSDFWEHERDLLETPKKQYELISKNNLAATWLVRYDGLTDPNVQKFLKSLDKNQEVGLFLEVTPKITQESGVSYNKSSSWHNAMSVLLIGYSPSDRKKMIDQAFSKYKEIFGTTPKSVGAWWIDAASLEYMKQKYNIEANMDVSDQYSTDGYQVWGQYWSTPFYPAKANALMPASSEEQKIGVVTIQWATRDPFNGYGKGVFESTYSVQSNDYMLHDLGISYFEKLLDIYPQVTIGLENDFEWNKYGSEYEGQIQALIQRQKKGGLSVKTMSDFAKLYKAQNPSLSKEVLIFANDPLGSDGKVVWYQTPNYRAGWFYEPNRGSLIRDLRILNGSVEESCLKVSCQTLNLGFNATSAIDEVNYQTKWLIDEGKISDVSVGKSANFVQIKYKNQAGIERTIQFYPNDIKVDGDIKPISTRILEAVSNPQSEGAKVESESNFVSQLDYSKVPVVTFNFIKFLVLTLLFFFLPGLLLTRKYFLAIPTGWALFTLVSFVLGYLKMSEARANALDFLLWLIPVISIAAFVKMGFPRISKPAVTKSRLILGSLLIIGSFVWLLTTFRSGLPFNYGYGYWGPNGHDAIWHLSLISELQRNFPPQNPVFAGVSLSNYHYFFDLLIAKSGSLFRIDNQDLLFRFFPLVISLLAGILIYKVTRQISSEKGAILAVFFLYFGGSLGWLVSYFRNGSFGGETMFWAQQSISTLLNPPFAISLVTFLAGLFLFYELTGQKGQLRFSIIPLTLLWGTLIEFKAYAGVLVLLSLGLLAFLNIFKKRFLILFIFIPVMLLSLMVFLPNNLKSGSLLVVSPFWLIETMITFEDRLGFKRLALAMESGVLYKLIASYLIGFAIFIIGNLGTRVFGFFSIKEFLRSKLLFLMALFGTVLPMIFIQSGTNWNIVQFFYYSILALNIFAGIGLALLWSKIGGKIGLIFVVIIMLFTLPTSFNTGSQYISKRPPSMLSSEEYKALEFLRMQPDGIVLNVPFDADLSKQIAPPIPLFAYASTAYVSAFSGQPVFMEDTINLEILGIDYKGRLNIIREFLKMNDNSNKILKENKISYVYLAKKTKNNIDEGKAGLRKIFENDEAAVFKAL